MMTIKGTNMTEITFRISDLVAFKMVKYRVRRDVFRTLFKNYIADVDRYTMQKIFSVAKDIPSDFFVNGVSFDSMTACLNVYVTSNSFQPVEDFDTLPVMEVYFDNKDLNNLDLSSSPEDS